MPPSPKPPRFFEGKKLKQPKSPMEPARRPRYSEPIACAASSITMRLCRRATSMMGSMSAIWPYRCTGMIARVFPVIAASIFDGSML